MAHPNKIKGNGFERLVRDFLAAGGIPADRIPAGATIDRGDIWVPGNTIQCKNVRLLALPSWWKDTLDQTAANNHRFGWIVHKRHGTTDPAKQWVTTDLTQLRAVLSELIK